MQYVIAILALGLLMAVHEGGHFLMARAFGMRVLKYSIGFGPVLWSKKPKGSDTTYQIALLPFLAYVQIAGMNPHEEIDPDDKKSYANASWLGRFLTIVAGPLANYLFAVLIVFVLLLAAGRPAGIDGLKVGAVDEGGAAAAAHIQPNDEVKTVGGVPVKDWKEMREQIQAHKGVPMTMVVLRDDKPVELMLTPSAKDGTIGVHAKELREKVGVLEAGKEALIRPPESAYAMLKGFGRLISGKEKPDLRGPVGIVQEAGAQLKNGAAVFVEFIALLSIYLCVFNLLPFPALDGGRLAFLLYEFIARRRPDAKVEARVHMVGLLALLTLMIPIFFKEIFQTVARLFVRG
jgi:regulator of sigma E protease